MNTGRSDRRVRREAYTSYLGCVERLDAMVSMYARPAERNHWESWLLEFRAAQVAVRLVESQSVLKARQRFGKLLLDLAPDVENGFNAGHPMQDALGVPYMRIHDDLTNAGRLLGDAMAQDLAYAHDSRGVS